MSDKWQCPHCRKQFEKTPQLMMMQSIGGITSNIGKPLECPSCGKPLDLKKLLNGEYDTRW